MKAFAILIAALLSAVPAAWGQMGPAEQDVDRPGEDLRSFPSDGWQRCSSSCGSQDDCWAYTYAKPKSQGEPGTCWLKRKAPQPRPSECCISGIRVMGPLEQDVDRPGSNLRPGYPSQLHSCRKACQQDSRCWAWTYVKPGVQGSQGMCWLKESAPEAVANGCCISGMRVVAATEPPRLPRAGLRQPAREATPALPGQALVDEGLRQIDPDALRKQRVPQFKSGLSRQEQDELIGRFDLGVRRLQRQKAERELTPEIHTGIRVWESLDREQKRQLLAGRVPQSGEPAFVVGAITVVTSLWFAAPGPSPKDDPTKLTNRPVTIRELDYVEQLGVRKIQPRAPGVRRPQGQLRVEQFEDAALDY